MSKRAQGKRGAIRPQKTPTVTGAWDESTHVARCSGARSLRAMHAWADPDGDPEDPASYRFAHHLTSDDGDVGAANIDACRSGIQKLNSADPGVPDEDREAVHGHLSAHVSDAGHKAPELKSARPASLQIRGLERRDYTLGQINHRAAGAKRYIEGHAAVFEQTTELWPGVREKVARGTFADTIRSDNIAGLFNHDPAYILGRNVAGTMSLAEDARGLQFSIEVDERQTYAANLLISIERGDVSGCSFGFQTLDDMVERSADEDGDEIIVRTLRKVQLFDVGPVVFPAYPQPDVSARSRLGGASFAEFAEARARLESGADDPDARALMQRVIHDLAAVAGPSQRDRERMRLMRMRLDLAVSRAA